MEEIKKKIQSLRDSWEKIKVLLAIGAPDYKDNLGYFHKKRPHNPQDFIKGMIHHIDALISDIENCELNPARLKANADCIIQEISQMLKTKVSNALSPPREEMTKNARDILKFASDAVNNEFNHEFNSLCTYTLEKFLNDQNLPEESIKSIKLKMIAYGYESDDLVSLYQALEYQGRLFLNCLYRAIKKSGVEEEKARLCLSPLVKSLETIEAYSTSYAHFVWVGAKPGNFAELLGVRSLKAAYPGQKIFFWVLNDYVEDYREELKRLGLDDVYVVSIENYAQKTEYHFDSGKTLDEEIEFFKALSAKKMAEAEKLTIESEKQLKKIDAIRDRVTIVDHVKPLIQLFEGGHICDVDLVFSPDDSKTQTFTLPNYSKWLFPLVMPRCPGADVWYFYCQRALRWDGNRQNYAAYEDDNVLKSDISFREQHLTHYNQTAHDIYSKRGNDPINGSFPKYLGDAICEIAGKFIHHEQTENEKIQMASIRRLNEYHHAQFGVDSSIGTQHKSAKYRLDIDDYRFCVLSLATITPIVKYYGQSYIPSAERNVATDLSSPLHVHLLTIDNKTNFENVLSQRQKFARLDIAHWFNASVREFMGFQFKQPNPLMLHKVTLLHLSLIVRPDLTDIIINHIPLGKLAAVLEHTAFVPSQLLLSGTDELSQPVSALSLAEICMAFNETIHYEITPEHKKCYEETKTSIINATVLVKIYKELPAEIQKQLAEQNNTVAEKLAHIIDWLNENKNSPSARFFNDPSIADKVSNCVEKLGIQKPADGKWTIECLRNQLIDRSAPKPIAGLQSPLL